jgi:hypothetical protein
VTPPSADPVLKTTPTPTPTDSQKKSPRGNILMALGDIGMSSDKSSGKMYYKFTVNSIAPVTCTREYHYPSENGVLVAVDMTIETTPELADSTDPNLRFSGSNFKYVAVNGTTFNGSLGTFAAFACLPDAETFPSNGMGPAEKVTAKVVLDLPAANGILILKSNPFSSSGFEYNF